MCLDVGQNKRKLFLALVRAMTSIITTEMYVFSQLIE